MATSTERAARVMVLGAHPDDCDVVTGGCAALWRQAGFDVCFVSATNGDAGHHKMSGAPLAARRKTEAANSAAVLGLRCWVLDNHDGQLEPTLARREEFIRVIRRFAPDLLITHRPWDYHPDHRYTGQLVQDASFLLSVPNICPDMPALHTLPVIMYAEDTFQKPLPFSNDGMAGHGTRSRKPAARIRR